ncbi:hypothetical protein B0H14DRAFT_3470972 [Mycena olivaceomarginata]|nr:hypothetical protein B0H14DRAFT_3470972 [Mycena olivaceomarginata]
MFLPAYEHSAPPLSHAAHYWLLTCRDRAKHYSGAQSASRAMENPPAPCEMHVVPALSTAIASTAPLPRRLATPACPAYSAHEAYSRARLGDVPRDDLPTPRMRSPLAAQTQRTLARPLRALRTHRPRWCADLAHDPRLALRTHVRLVSWCCTYEHVRRPPPLRWPSAGRPAPTTLCVTLRPFTRRAGPASVSQSDPGGTAYMHPTPRLFGRLGAC